MSRKPETLRQHLPVFIIVAILIVVMTFPTIVYVFNTEVAWLPTGNHHDTWMKVWDAWYGKRILDGKADYYYTDLLFYPRGVSLVYHNFSIPHMLVFGGLQALMPLTNAYSLTFLLIVASVTCSAYVYMLYLFKDKWIALFGAVIVGLSPHVVGYPEHPEYRFIATVPLAMYFLHRGLDERRIKLVFLSALTTGLTAYVSLHISVCLVIMLGMILLYNVASRWKDMRFWVAVFCFAATAGLISAPRILPMIESAQALQLAVKYAEVNNDLLEYFINARHPLIKLAFPDESFLWGLHAREARYSSYLGYSVLFLIGAGFLSKTSRRGMLPWLAMAAPFLLLRLGSELTIGGIKHPQILLPKHFLDMWLPAVTEAFRITSAFHIGALIPLAALACIGATALLRKLGTPRPRVALFMLTLVGVVCFEYYQPVRQGELNKSEIAFIDWLQDEPGDVRLIHLPLRHLTRFKANLYQTFHGFSIAEGLIARRSAGAYDYIYNNQLLASWINRQVSSCVLQQREAHLPALNQLIADGFTHVVWHKRLDQDVSFAVSLAGASASYEDDFVSIYRIHDLLQACEPGHMAEHFSAFPYAAVYLTPSIIHECNGLVMSLHQSRSASEAFRTYFSHVSFDQKDMVHFSYNDKTELVVDGTKHWFADLENINGSFNGVWLINNPHETDLPSLPIYQGWFTRNYRFCRRAYDHTDGTIDLYLKPDIPCEALDAHKGREARYDGGARLHNVSYDMAGDQITFYLVWSIDSERDYGFSLQLFDESGRKAVSYDNAVFRDAVNVHGIDISSLPAGAYDMKLILYDRETGDSENGVIVKGDQRFDRALDIGMITID
ncbi:MAG: hypothetical protein OXI77_12135 [Chloroflexota bacterium]|nr:hypothetical protein [Chloroflexota bacterium]MDE2907835.1 hypothetical protein [Chloroflexota bacterium]